jgi:hypothetical protein
MGTDWECCSNATVFAEGAGGVNATVIIGTTGAERRLELALLH